MILEMLNKYQTKLMFYMTVIYLNMTIKISFLTIKAERNL
jgi:hypothetical protein